MLDTKTKTNLTSLFLPVRLGIQHTRIIIYYFSSN